MRVKIKPMKILASIPMSLWISLLATGVLVLIAVFLLLYFTLFSHLRIKRQINELSSHFEHYHSHLFGQISQYIKRIENISMTNLIYVNTHLTFNKRFKDVRDKSDSAAQVAVNHLKDLLAEHDFKDLKTEIPEARKTIERFEQEVESLNADLHAVIRPEEECRQNSSSLKEKLRTLKQDYNVKEADLTLVGDSFTRAFTLLDDKFSEFERYVESAQYEEANALLPKVGEVIDALSRCIKELPNLCVTIQTVIPDKLSSLQNRYEEMGRAGYPLHHLLSDSNIAEMQQQLDKITAKIQSFSLSGVAQELDGIIARIDDYFTSFDNEKDARVAFESECEGVYKDDSETENRYIRVCNSLPRIREIYVIPEQEQLKIDAIKAAINLSGATKRSLDTLIHSGTRQPYTLLVEKMNTLRDESSDAAHMLDDFDSYLVSLKADSEEACRCLYDYDERVHTAEVRLRQIDIPDLTEKYEPQITSLYETIDQIKANLKTPIDVESINELVSSLKANGDSACREIDSYMEKMYLAEASILYGNRERMHLSEIKLLIQQAEKQYWSGDFGGAYSTATNAAKSIRNE